MPPKRQSSRQRELFTTQPALPQGFAYAQNILSQAEEAGCVRIFSTLPFKPFEFYGYLGNRRIVSFGWRYDYSKRALRDSADLPEFLKPLREAAAGFAGWRRARLLPVSRQFPLGLRHGRLPD